MSRSSRRASGAARPYHHGDLKNALIQAGTEILASEGVAGLTLRKAARRAGVSHSAPYAHFADRDALVAAISTEGLRLVRERVEHAIRAHEGDALRQLQEAAWETARFGLEHPDNYEVAFSVTLEREADYPEYVAMAQGSFDLLVRLVQSAQAARVVAPGPPERAVLELWALVHGLVSLLIHGQVPRRAHAGTPLRELVVDAVTSHLQAPARPARARRGPGRRARRSGA
jgi:AcrR family transcriptional regulator